MAVDCELASAALRTWKSIHFLKIDEK